MQIRARSEAKRILRVFRLGCASEDMATNKILAHPVRQRKAEKTAESRSSSEETLAVEILSDRSRDLRSAVLVGWPQDGSATYCGGQAGRKMGQPSSSLKKRRSAAQTQGRTTGNAS